MTRGYWIALVFAATTIGAIVGWRVGTYVAMKSGGLDTMDVATYSRYVQAKERATLIQLLASNKFESAKDLLYILLNGNLNDFLSSKDERERMKACEILQVLGADAILAIQSSAPPEQKSRKRLGEGIAKATVFCPKLAKYLNTPRLVADEVGPALHDRARTLTVAAPPLRRDAAGLKRRL